MKEIVMVYQEMSGDAIKSRLNIWAYLEPSGEAGRGTGRMPVGDRKTSQETKVGPGRTWRGSNQSSGCSGRNKPIGSDDWWGMEGVNEGEEVILQNDLFLPTPTHQ